MLIPFDELFARHSIHPAGVVHCGASYAQEADAYAAQGVKRVIWIEALPHIHAKLVKKMAAYPGSTALLACLSDRDGESVTFNVASNEGQSSSFLKFGTHSIQHPDVTFTQSIQMKTIRMDTLLKKHDIKLGDGWFLNVDVQGAELLALKGMGDLLRRFDWIYTEINTEHLYQGCCLVGDIDAYLHGNGFVRVETKLTNHHWGDALYIRHLLHENTAH